MGALNNVLGLLSQDPQGAIVVSNIVDCLDEALVDGPFVRAFLDAASAAFDQDKPNTTIQIVGMLAKVARGELPVAASSSTSSIARSFLFGCGVAAVPKYDTCSCVLDVGMFKQYLVSDAKVNDGHGFFLSNPDPADPELKRAIDALNGRDDIFKPSANLGGGNVPLFWVCPTNALSLSIVKHPTGDGVRDTLGLIHHGAGVALIEIRFPANKLLSVRWARPTFADAGVNSRFRTVTDIKPSPTAPDWGCTVDLGRFAAGEQVLDGLPERVVEPLAFDRDLEAQFAFVGGTTVTRGLDAACDDDQAFAIRVTRGRSAADLRNRLAAL